MRPTQTAQTRPFNTHHHHDLDTATCTHRRASRLHQPRQRLAGATRSNKPRASGHQCATAKESVAAVANKNADLGFFAIDPARAKDIAFTQAYLHIDACYVVRKVSAIHTEQDLDQTNSRIVVGLGSAYDLFLSRHIQKAELVRAPSTQDVMPVFWANGYEVAAGLQHAMSQEVKQHAQLRMLSPPFMAIAQAMGCHPKQSDEVKAGLQDFLVKQRHVIAKSIAKHGLSGVKAA